MGWPEEQKNTKKKAEHVKFIGKFQDITGACILIWGISVLFFCDNLQKDLLLLHMHFFPRKNDLNRFPFQSVSDFHLYSFNAHLGGMMDIHLYDNEFKFLLAVLSVFIQFSQFRMMSCSWSLY